MHNFGIFACVLDELVSVCIGVYLGWCFAVRHRCVDFQFDSVLIVAFCAILALAAIG